MKKQSKQPSKTPHGKRPKSVLRKAWKTRRARAELAKLPKYDPKAPLVVDREAFLREVAAHMPQTDTANDNKAQSSQTRHSEIDGIARTIELHREEMLLGFMGDMNAIRQTRKGNDHHPMFLSRAQAEAIESFLIDHGYSPWGKGSGMLMSVSTKPTIDKAA